MNKEELFCVLKRALWGNGSAVANQDIFEEMKKHAIAVLPACCLSTLSLSPELERKWKSYILQQVTFCTQSCYEQANLPIHVPYVILKGTSAAKYYPYPNYRTMGDIDIMTRREDFDIACKQLVDHGYRIITDIYKEINLKKNGVSIDLHRQFASFNNPEYVKYLDELIIQNINPSHVLPDTINGLVLLNHINQHLEHGLGLRQIIDWMMFVDKCLPDEKWPDFFELVKKTGLEKLAIVCTHMCEIYLGLPYREWCAGADTALCTQLMDYVLSCGNFGNKIDINVGESVLAFIHKPIATLKLLQRQGLVSRKATNEHSTLRPFAWIYRLLCYASRGLKRDKAISRMMREYVGAKKKNAMFESLGVKTAAKGIVQYKDGKYSKE